MRTFSTLALALLLLSPCSAQARRVKTAPSAPFIPNVVLTGHAAVQVLKQCSRDAPTHVSGYWTPTTGDIKFLETEAPAFLSHQRSGPRPAWNKYARQYAGFMQNGRRMIYVNCAYLENVKHVDQHMKAAGEKGLDWQHTAAVVCDGGANFFGMEYDVQTHQFRHLSFNGPG